MFKKLFAGARTKREAHTLYQELVSQARLPRFYQPPFNVADSIEGRFDMIMLHLFVVDQLLAGDESLVGLRRGVREAMINDMDRSLREMGIGDMSIGKQMKKIGSALLGRLQSFEQASKAEDREQALADAIARNMTDEAGSADCAALARYVCSTLDEVLSQHAAGWQHGSAIFGGAAAQQGGE